MTLFEQFKEVHEHMRSAIRIGIIPQPALPKLLEPMIEAILREQFRKLCSLLGEKNLTLISSIDDKFSEAACISAIEEGMKLELQPLKALEHANDKDAEISKKIHSILKKQVSTLAIENRIEEAKVIEVSDIIVIGFDETDTSQSKIFDRTKKTLFGFEAACQPTEKLCIEINVPQQWTPDADGNVYFEYITRAPGSLKMLSTVEIPEKLIQKWKFDISEIQH